eukprot:scaffold21864_cov68-Skeletonema_dohrnii-CCMP3373.AAC.1
MMTVAGATSLRLMSPPSPSRIASGIAGVFFQRESKRLRRHNLWISHSRCYYRHRHGEDKEEKKTSEIGLEATLDVRQTGPYLARCCVLFFCHFVSFLACVCAHPFYFANKTAIFKNLR